MSIECVIFWFVLANVPVPTCNRTIAPATDPQVTRDRSFVQREVACKTAMVATLRAQSIKQPSDRVSTVTL